MGQSVIGPLVLGQAVAVHLGQKAEVIREREIPDRQSDRQAKALPPGVERQGAAVRPTGTSCGTYSSTCRFWFRAPAVESADSISLDRPPASLGSSGALVPSGTMGSGRRPAGVGTRW